MDHLVSQLGPGRWRMPHFCPFAKEERWGPLAMLTATEAGVEPSRLEYDPIGRVIRRSGLMGRLGGRYGAEGGWLSLSSKSPWRATYVVGFCKRPAMGAH